MIGWPAGIYEMGTPIIPNGPAPFKTTETDRYSVSKGFLEIPTSSRSAYLQFWKSELFSHT